MGTVTAQAGHGLERSCRTDWIRGWEPVAGVERFAAWLFGAYARHRHDTYAICITTGGAQCFDYRGAAQVSTRGQVVVLHPDETHDGRAGGPGGFGYRQVYVDPARVADALHALCGRAIPLPFVRAPVSRNATLAAAVAAAFADGSELAADAVVMRIAEGLLAADSSLSHRARSVRHDRAALERARAFLDAEKGRAVRSGELEALTGLTRYELARQFRAAYGTSPYRYLTMRRLDSARARLKPGVALAGVALEAGFADQAHFTRAFKAAYGLTPGRYTRLAGNC
jgi:AraC-like DNA-binding protein